MLDNFAQVAKAAARYEYEYVLDEVPETELPSWGEPGIVVLIARCENRLRRLVGRAAGAGAADREDLQQAAILGFLEGLARDSERDVEDADKADLFTFAHNSIINALQDANRAASPKPARQSAHDRFWAAMDACDGDAVKAREWSSLQRLTGHALQDKADGGNLLAADILDTRIAYWERRGHDVAERMDETGRGLEPHVFDGIHAALTYTSIDAPLTDAEPDAGTLHDVVSDDAAQAAYANVEDRLVVADLLSTLTVRDAEIVRALFGIDVPARTPTELAEEYDISPVRVRGIKAAAVRKLAKAVAK